MSTRLINGQREHVALALTEKGISAAYNRCVNKHKTLELEIGEFLTLFMPVHTGLSLQVLNHLYTRQFMNRLSTINGLDRQGIPDVENKSASKKKKGTTFAAFESLSSRLNTVHKLQVYDPLRDFHFSFGTWHDYGAYGFRTNWDLSSIKLPSLGCYNLKDFERLINSMEDPIWRNKWIKLMAQVAAFEADLVTVLASMMELWHTLTTTLSAITTEESLVELLPAAAEHLIAKTPSNKGKALLRMGDVANLNDMISKGVPPCCS